MTARRLAAILAAEVVSAGRSLAIGASQRWGGRDWGRPRCRRGTMSVRAVHGSCTDSARVFFDTHG